MRATMKVGIISEFVRSELRIARFRVKKRVGFPAGIIRAAASLQLSLAQDDRLQCAKLTSFEPVACI
jgi:hypothetical protein